MEGKTLLARVGRTGPATSDDQHFGPMFRCCIHPACVKRYGIPWMGGAILQLGVVWIAGCIDSTPMQLDAFIARRTCVAPEGAPSLTLHAAFHPGASLDATLFEPVWPLAHLYYMLTRMKPTMLRSPRIAQAGQSALHGAKIACIGVCKRSNSGRVYPGAPKTMK